MIETILGVAFALVVLGAIANAVAASSIDTGAAPGAFMISLFVGTCAVALLSLVLYGGEHFILWVLDEMQRRNL